jgi:hypothetical protein
MDFQIEDYNAENNKSKIYKNVILIGAFLCLESILLENEMC